MQSHNFGRARKLSAVAVVGLVLASSVLIPASANAAGVTRYVDGEAIGTARASDSWWAEQDTSLAGEYAVTQDGPEGDSAMKLTLPTSAARVYLYNSFPDTARPTDLDALRDGASYTYAGTNVNFQFEIVFKPVDARFGPNPVAPGSPGTQYCDQANAWGIDNVPADWCYTVIKWEPLAVSSGWTTIDLSADTAVDSARGISGWRSQKRIGEYAKAGAYSGSGTFSQYLDQIEELEVVSYVFGAGSGTPGPTDGWVREYTAGGTTVLFGNAPAVSTSTRVAISPTAGSVAGSSVTVSGSVLPANAQGFLEILDRGVSLGEGAATGGSFTVTTSRLSVGTHTLSARFTPASSVAFTPSESTPLTFVVRAAPVDPPTVPPVAPAGPTDPAMDAPVKDVPAEAGEAPTAPTTEATLELLGTSTDELVARFAAANGGATPPALAEVFTLSASTVLDADGNLDVARGFTASVQWSDDNGDRWVDLWAYSTPTYIGSFAVVDGVLNIDGADLSALASGDHHLVLVGQTSGKSIVAAVTVAEAAEAQPAPPAAIAVPAAAAPAIEPWLLWGGAILLCALLATGALVAYRRLRA